MTLRLRRAVNLEGANLSSANLTSATLRDADLSNAYLTNANLSGADLKDAELIGTRLTGANLTNAELQGTYLWSAQMQNATMTGAVGYWNGSQDAFNLSSTADFGSGTICPDGNLSIRETQTIPHNRANEAGKKTVLICRPLPAAPSAASTKVSDSAPAATAQRRRRNT